MNTLFLAFTFLVLLSLVSFFGVLSLPPLIAFVFSLAAYLTTFVDSLKGIFKKMDVFLNTVSFGSDITKKDLIPNSKLFQFFKFTCVKNKKVEDYRAFQIIQLIFWRMPLVGVIFITLISLTIFLLIVLSEYVIRMCFGTISGWGVVLLFALNVGSFVFLKGKAMISLLNFYITFSIVGVPVISVSSSFNSDFYIPSDSITLISVVGIFVLSYLRGEVFE